MQVVGATGPRNSGLKKMRCCKLDLLLSVKRGFTNAITAQIKGLPFWALQPLVSRVPSLTGRVCRGHTVCIGVSHPFGGTT